MKISVVISAYNEEKRIEKTLQGASFADEIIFVDNTSTDNTLTIAKKYTKKVFTRKNLAMLNVNKNFGFTKATGDWILCIDADEYLTKELTEEIKAKVSNSSDVVGYWIPRKNIIFGKWIQNSIWWPDYQLRLFRRGEGKFPEEHVHEVLLLNGKTDKIQNPISHDNYSSVSQYIYKLDKIYTENEAENIIKSGTKITWIDAIRFPFNDFLKTFFAQKGYKDGLHGLVLSLLQAFYAEIVFAKVWEKEGFKEYNNSNFLHNLYSEYKKIKKELDYWFLSSFISDTSNLFKKIILKIKRRLSK